jgi:hypothetical protein
MSKESRRLIAIIIQRSSSSSCVREMVRVQVLLVKSRMTSRRSNAGKLMHQQLIPMSDQRDFLGRSKQQFLDEMKTTGVMQSADSSPDLPVVGGGALGLLCLCCSQRTTRIVRFVVRSRPPSMTFRFRHESVFCRFRRRLPSSLCWSSVAAALFRSRQVTTAIAQHHEKGRRRGKEIAGRGSV